METKMILRDLRNADLKSLEDVIRKTWNYDKFTSSKTAKKLAKAYLASCLANQTYALTAEVDGKPVGIILGKNIEKHRCPLRYRWRQITALCRLLASKEGRDILGVFKNIDHIDRELLSQCEKDYKGEVALFALDPESRGLGIGKKLFLRLMDYMKKEEIEDVYLYTDTSCNFGFYEHQGMKRQQQYQKVFHMKGQKETMEFYLYDISVSKKIPNCRNV